MSDNTKILHCIFIGFVVDKRSVISATLGVNAFLKDKFCKIMQKKIFAMTPVS